MTRAPEAWSGFWEGEPAAHSGATLADLPPPLRALLDAPWAALAAALPKRARVLDLATGGGAVLALLGAARPDLTLTGVDSADTPKRAGMQLLGRVANERLPFGDQAFDAITSRFGIEYGAREASAAEAARVLAPGGRLVMVLHHAESAVLQHNAARRIALAWAVGESGWLDKALALARARRALALPVPPGFRAAPAEGRSRFPGQSVAWEFLTGVAQVLHTAPPEHGEARLQALAAQAEGELARLDALAAAALDHKDVGALRAAFGAAGVTMATPARIEAPGGPLLAWRLEGRRDA